MSGLDPDRSAAPAEAALLRETLALDRAAQQVMRQRVLHAKTALHDAICALRVAQEAMESAQYIHDQVTAAQVALDSRVERARGLLHPIRRLPEDILSMIFLEWRQVAGGDSESLVRVACVSAAVCARWRRVALNLSSIWRTIRLNLDRVTEDTALSWCDYIMTFLARSRTSPVDVTISGPSRIQDELAVPSFWSAVEQAFARCRSIDLDLFGERPGSRMPPCFHQCAPYLEKFRLRYELEDDDDTTNRWEFFLSAPLLRNIYWLGPKLCWAPASETFSCVRDLELITVTLDAQGIADLFEKMPNIRSLFALAMLAGDIPPTFSVTSRTLERLKLHAEDFDAHVVPKMRFPALVEAALDTFNGPLDRSTAMALLRNTMPAVRYLSLGHVRNISHTRWEPRHLLSMDLDFIYDDSAEDLLGQFTQPDARGEWLCPQLQEMRLPSPIPRATVRDSILRLARARGYRATAGRQPPARLRLVAFEPRLGPAADDVRFAAELKTALSKP